MTTQIEAEKLVDLTLNFTAVDRKNDLNIVEIGERLNLF